MRRLGDQVHATIVEIDGSLVDFGVRGQPEAEMIDANIARIGRAWTASGTATDVPIVR